MDFQLERLLNLPNITVFSCQEQEGFVVLKLELLNEGITCPHCQSYTDHIHQTRLMLIRDLSILPAFFLEKPPKLLNTIFPIFAIILLIEQPVELWRD